MIHPNEVKEFARVRMEQTPNNTQIARDIKNKFNQLYADYEIEQIRTNVRKWRDKWHVEARKVPIKRLFFDIETSYHILEIKSWSLRNYNKYFNHEDIKQHKQIICISYKWQYEDKVHTLDWRMGEREMIKEFIKIMGDAHEIVGHNGDRFDIKELRTRAIYYGLLMFPNYRTLDTLKKARNYFNFASNKLDYIGQYLNVGKKLDHEGFELWEKVVAGDVDALERMIKYCEQDVILLEDTFFVLNPFITHNNNFAVLTGGERWDCPECASENVEMFRFYSTPMGVIRREMKCNDCKQQYKVSNKTYMLMLEANLKRF